MQVLETVKLIIQTKSNTLLSNEDNTSASLFKLIAQEILKCSKPSLPPGIPSGGSGRVKKPFLKRRGVNIGKVTSAWLFPGNSSFLRLALPPGIPSGGRGF